MSREKNFILHGFILAVAGIFVRIIGLIYRIPLVRIVGEEGMGYYSQAFNIYAIILLLSSYSLPLAVSKMISARIGKKEYKNISRIFLVAFLYASIVGIIGSAFVWFFADTLALIVFRMPLSAYALKALAPTILVMAYLGVFRGYYQGHGTMLPTAVSQVLEQVANAIMSIFAASYLSNMIIKESGNISLVRAYGAAGGTIGTGIGALVALLMFVFLHIFLLIRKDKGQKIKDISDKESYIYITKILFLTVVPVILSTAIYNLNGIIDGAIFGNIMSKFTSSEDLAKQYGIYTSKYLILINVPVAIANAMSSSLIPELSKANASGNKVRINSSIGMVMRFAVLISLPASVGLMVLAKPIISLLFGYSQKAVSLMQVGAIAVVFYSISTITNAILQGTNNMSIPVKNSIIALILHIIALIAFLNIFKFGTYSLVFANIIFALLMCIFNALAIKNKLYYKQEILKTFVLPSVCSLLMGISIYLIYIFLDKVISSDFVNTILPMLFAVIIYPILLIKTKTLTKEEILLMPKGRKIVSIFSRLHLI